MYNSDWSDMTKEQRQAVTQWRDRIIDVLQREVAAFEEKYPELHLELALSSIPLVLAKHPELEPPALPKKEEPMKDKDLQSEEFERALANQELTPEERKHEERLKTFLADMQAQDLQSKTTALKSLRVSINTAIAEARSIADTHIQRGPGGRELSLCITNLQQARMWAGEALGEIGHKLPEEYRDEAK